MSYHIDRVTGLQWQWDTMVSRSLSSGSLGGSIYLNFMLSGAVELVSNTACFSIQKLGRKGPHVFGMVTAGLACLATILVDQFMKGIYLIFWH